MRKLEQWRTHHEGRGPRAHVLLGVVVCGRARYRRAQHDPDDAPDVRERPCEPPAARNRGCPCHKPPPAPHSKVGSRMSARAKKTNGGRSPTYNERVQRFSHEPRAPRACGFILPGNNLKFTQAAEEWPERAGGVCLCTRRLRRAQAVILMPGWQRAAQRLTRSSRNRVFGVATSPLL